MPNPIKLLRYEALITETINKTIVFEVKNKYAKLGRVTYVKLSKDISVCKAYIECTDRKQVDNIVEQLNLLTGLFRSKVCGALDIYKTPKIVFFPDKSIDYAENIDKIIKTLH